MKIDDVLCKRLERLAKITFTGNHNHFFKDEIIEIIEYIQGVKNNPINEQKISVNNRIVKISDLREDSSIHDTAFFYRKGYIIAPKI